MPQSNSEDQNSSENQPKSWVKKKVNPAKSYAKKKTTGGDRDSLAENPKTPTSSKYGTKKGTSFSNGGTTRRVDIDKKDL